MNTYAAAFYITYSELAIHNYIFLSMLIYFDKPECPRHKRPFEYLCMSPECLCQIRLCTSCANEHIKKYSKSDFMKENNFYKKLEMETDIIDKQYSFLEKHFQKEDDSSLLNSKNEESIRMVEFIMKVVNEDKKAVFKAIDQFSFNHSGVRKKLANIQTTYNRQYVEAIQNPAPLSIMINLSTNQGMERMRKKVLDCQNTSKKFNEFLVATQKYGDSCSSFLVGLGFKNVLLKEDIRQLIDFGNGNDKKISLEGKPVQPSQKQIVNGQNSKESNRCEQLFVPVPTTPRKIKLLTPQKRPKTSSSADRLND